MKKTLISIPFIGVLAILVFACSQKESEDPNQKQHQIPHLKKQGETTQLIVNDEPYLILGGELGNSSFTSLEYMEPVWSKLIAMNVNTVLVPVYWELIEPVEGEFDFELYDKLIKEARKNDLKLIPLWFGSWKNSMSSHAPGWIKINQQRFPRIKDDNGRSHEILTPFSENNLKADLNAFTELMKHIKAIDQQENTVIMVQVENEIGMLPVARDYHPLANQAFTAKVPDDLMQYLQQNKEKPDSLQRFSEITSRIFRRLGQHRICPPAKRQCGQSDRGP